MRSDIRAVSAASSSDAGHPARRADLISDMLRGLQHQLEILQRIAVRRYLHKDSDAEA